MKRLLVVGAGGHGRSVAELALSSREFQLAGFADDTKSTGEKVWGLPILGSTAALPELRALADIVIVAIGANQQREKLHQILHRHGFELATLIHPRAIISRSALIGPGCAVMAGAIVGTEARLGEGAILNSGAVVDHHCTVDDFGHLGTNACMAGGSTMGRGAWLQAGASLGYNVHVQAYEMIPPGQARSITPQLQC